MENQYQWEKHTHIFIKKKNTHIKCYEKSPKVKFFLPHHVSYKKIVLNQVNCKNTNIDEFNT